MNCRRCHHAGEAHAESEWGASMAGLGECRIPGCACAQYLDPMASIDEELV